MFDNYQYILLPSMTGLEKFIAAFVKQRVFISEKYERIFQG